MSKGVAITYGDIAVEAKENFSPTSSEDAFNTVKNLQRYNMQTENYANPCELYQTVLDGEQIALPSDLENANIGLWSEQISGDDGKFANNITLTMTSTGQYSSQGFTFTFDKYNNIYPTSIMIQWYRDNELLDFTVFNPDSAFYFCKNKVENFNQVVITFGSLNMPKNRLKLTSIDFGYGTVFYGDELRNVKLIQQLDPISSEIAINTCDFTLDSKSDIVYSFQAKQPLSVSYNDKLLATVFVKTSKRTGRFLWNINAEDYISLMDNIPFKGNIYDGVNAKVLFKDIFDTAKVPYSITTDFDNVTLSGHIPYTTCRQALMQVAFACQAVIDTSGSDRVKVFKLENDVKQTVPLNRIMQGQNFEDDETVTGVELTVHTYEPKTTETSELYKAADSGTGTDILIKFSEPMHDLSIAKGTITESGANYAIITANRGCILSGKGYDHITEIRRKLNPKVLASELENISSITGATLVSVSNVDSVLETCYNWLTRVNAVNLKIIEGKTVIEGDYYRYGTAKYGTALYGGFEDDTVVYDKAVNVGEVISAETEYLGIQTGRIIRQSFGLNGNIIVKEAVLK